MSKTCCSTGHRKLSEEQEQIAVVGLVGLIDIAIEQGYKKFISGFAEGIDLIAANIIIKNKMRNKDLFLEAAIPHRKRIQSKDKNFRELLEKCDGINVLQDEYSRDCFFKRDRYMIDNSDLLIAVWDGRKYGGTYYTINYAQKCNKDVKIIPI